MRPIIYILHSGNLYGTERMALATMIGLQAPHQGLLLAPPGPVHEEALALNVPSRTFRNVAELFRHLSNTFRQHRELNLFATGVSHSLIAHILANLFACRLHHLHVVHGGTDERLSYGRKALLNHLPITLVAVSGFVRERLLAHGCRAERIQVIENFLPSIGAIKPRTMPIAAIKRVAILSRIDPIKRVGLLLDAIERCPKLCSLQFDIFGEGSEYTALELRGKAFSNVRFHGYQPSAAARLTDFDLLLHTCAEEPFGLAILEAMASDVPVLVPSAGGASSLVENWRTGFQFPANCSGGLANTLEKILGLSGSTLASVTIAARREIETRFSSQRGLSAYAKLLEELSYD